MENDKNNNSGRSGKYPDTTEKRDNSPAYDRTTQTLGGEPSQGRERHTHGNPVPVPPPPKGQRVG
jgi:hypothetical protein